MFDNDTTNNMASSSQNPPELNGGRRYRSVARDDNGADVDRHDWTESEAPPLYSIVRYNMMSQPDADHVWRRVLEDWDMDSSTQEERSELRQYLTAAFCISTSKDMENRETRFTLRSGKEVCIDALYKRVAEVVATGNDSRLRIWVRSFENGYFVRAQHTMLSDPANVELRTLIAGGVGEDAAQAPYMFDTADFLAHAGARLSPEETRMIAKYKAVRTSMASASAHAAGEVTARNDFTSVNSTAGARARPTTTLNAAAPPLPSQDARMGFAGGMNLR